MNVVGRSVLCDGVPLAFLHHNFMHEVAVIDNNSGRSFSFREHNALRLGAALDYNQLD